MRSKEDIEKVIREALLEVTGAEHFAKDTILISSELGIAPAHFLYIFDIIERQLSMNVYEIFEASTFEVMTIENLSDALYNLSKQTIENKC